jgi:type VI secretion system secreted protein VgrG
MTSKLLVLSVIVALAGFLPQSKASIDLGSAGSFAVMGPTVTSTGNTVLNGNLGGSTISGFYTPGIVNGTIYGVGAVLLQAQNDASTAYTALSDQTPTENLTGQDLGGQTLKPGVYQFDSSAGLGVTGTLKTLTLNGNGIYVFQIGSTLTTANSSSIVLENGAQAANVYWQVGTSATLESTTTFEGSIVALTSISMDDGVII